MLLQLKDSLAILLAVFQPALNVPSVAAGPAVDLGYATYEGAFDSESNITQFLGMRYAAPPTGDFRWRPPQAPPHVDGVQKATSQPPMCPQAGWWGHAKSLPAFMKGERTVEKATLLKAASSLLSYNTGSIHKFGGNPLDVTIWGVSAGAGSVYQHVVANGGKTTPPLFNTAITSSAFVPPQYAVDDIVCERLNANMGVSTFSGTYAFTPVVDGTLIQQAPAKSLAQGKINGDHLLSVTNANEGQLFVNVFVTEDDGFDVALYLRNVWPKLKDDEIVRALKLYADLTPVNQSSAILAEAQFAIDNALHGFDTGYYFPDVNKLFPKTYNNSVFDAAFASAFTNFALAKDPNVKVAEDVTPAWAPWGDDALFEMVFNKTEEGFPDVRQSSTDKQLVERCSFWESIAPSVGQ
ncbi:Alpha/Beta hydrolase protein [Schizophyllum fasciatum]